MNVKHNIFMSKAIRLARLAYRKGEVPVGAVVVKGKKIVGAGYNLCETLQIPIAHAELIAMLRATRRIGPILEDCILYVTLRPCIMCMVALKMFRVPKVVFGCEAECGVSEAERELVLVHSGGEEAKEIKSLLTGFFSLRRLRNKMERWLSG